MKICMLTYSYYESDTRVMQYANALVRRGDIVDVLALGKTGTPAFEVLNGVNVYRIQSRTIDEKGRNTYLLRILRFLLRTALILTRRQLSQRYQLIHVHSVPDFLVFAALVPKLIGARVILDIHDLLPELYASKFAIKPDSVQYRLLLLTEKASACFANHVIVANHLWKDRIAVRAVPAGKCTAICNYPDLQMFHRRPKNGTNGKFTIIYPGSLNAHQGVDVALRSFAQVADKIPTAEFHIYGEGPARPALQTLSAGLGLNGRVFFHGLVPTREVARLMASADLAVEPKLASSKFGNEAASTKIMEFMALGVPVIASRTKIHSYYFDDRVVRFFESENESDLAQAILDLFRDSRLREQLTTQASCFVQQNNWDVKKEEYLRLVDSLTGKDAAPAD